MCLEEPAVATYQRLEAHALVRGDRHVPAGPALVLAFAMRDQDAPARGISALQEPCEIIRLDATGEPKLAGAAAVPARGHDTFALTLGVVVPARELALVIVARLPDAQRWRGAQHEEPRGYTPAVPSEVRKDPLKGGSVPRGSEGSQPERLLNFVSGRSS